MTSTFYFDATATSAKDFFRDIPIFAVHAMTEFPAKWESGEVTSRGEFQEMMGRLSPQVPLYLAMPRVIAGRYFTKDREYKKIAIYAFRPVSGSSWQSDGGYMVGATIALVIQNVQVKEVVPIMQWKGLPAPPQVQKNYLERKIGRETYAPVAVKLWCSQGDVVA